MFSHITSATHPFRDRRRSYAALVAAGGLCLAGLGGAPAHAAGSGGPGGGSTPDSPCPVATDLSALSQGDAVHGLTVSKGTTPEAFTGTYKGVIQDGIAPDLDLIVVELSSPSIDAAGGIWSGMSGSPVYADDGSLIGAVSWAMSWSPSPIAGVTPAAEMQAMLDAAPTSATTSSAMRAATSRDHVTIPTALARDLVAAGDTTSTAADGGMRPLPLSMTVSGLTQKRINQVTERMPVDNARFYAAPGGTTAAVTDVPIVAGGNLAASISYGTISYTALGTATAVCGDEVLGFGHSMLGTGPSTLTMHNADTLYVQPDAVGGSYKVANITGPLGTISDDRLGGIHGTIGPLPAGAAVTSTASVPGGVLRNGASTVTVPSFLPDVGMSSMVAIQDRALDGYGPGSAADGWTVTGLRGDGTTWSYTRNDRFASNWDISLEPALELYAQLYQLEHTRTAGVAITGVSTRSSLSHTYQRFNISKLKIRRHGVWRTVRTSRPLVLKAGTTRYLRVVLTSSALGTKRPAIALRVPPRSAGRHGYLQVTGGNGYQHENDSMYEENAVSPSLNTLLARFQKAPRNDAVLADLHFRAPASARVRHSRTRALAVVDGAIRVEVRAVR